MGMWIAMTACVSHSLCLCFWSTKHSNFPRNLNTRIVVFFLRSQNNELFFYYIPFSFHCVRVFCYALLFSRCSLPLFRLRFANGAFTEIGSRNVSILNIDMLEIPFASSENGVYFSESTMEFHRMPFFPRVFFSLSLVYSIISTPTTLRSSWPCVFPTTKISWNRLKNK